MKTIYIFLLFVSCFLFSVFSRAQLKFIVEDFEGIADGTTDLEANGIFTFGNIKAAISSNVEEAEKSYSGKRNIKLIRNGKEDFGGWGKGVGLNIELDETKDYFNFYVASNDTGTIKIELQEDDNGNNIFEKENDDSWIYLTKIQNSTGQLISIPLNQFKDDNSGGDGIFNCSYKHGKLFAVIFSFIDSAPNLPTFQSSNLPAWSFDFISFSQGKLPEGKELFSAPPASPSDFCSLGAWSKEGNKANFADIPSSFEKIFSSEKKIGVAHFFQPFAFDGSTEQNLYPSVERINKVIEQGYIPIITLEDHFVNTNPNIKQPNLYSIVEGHFDSFFVDWAKEIKQVNGIVLLRILHEFNGDWYPWCLSKNDNNPQLLVNAFRHIRNIFYEQDARNVKFIWCPNSMSVPQESWNYIIDAYPGSEWVDFVGMDVYNGAGKSTLWRSFRKEGIENYFMLTQQVPDKPLLICEAASRERKESEDGQTKAEWLRQMSQTLSSDMSKVRLLCWFNEAKSVGGEKKTFPVNSSPQAQNAFLNFVLKNNYFKDGAAGLKSLIGIKEDVAGNK